MTLSVLAATSLVATALGHQVSISVDASSSLGPWTPIHRFYGCDEPNYAYYPRGSALLRELGDIGKDQTFFRTHNLLTTGEPGLVGVPGLKWGSTNAYTVDDNGNPTYNFTIIDDIFDHYLAGNVKPYLEIGFMPKALAVDPDPYFFDFDPEAGADNIYTGWSHPPKSYERWGELVYKLATHLVDRYGVDEVNEWYFEVWNEPNIPYWNGTTKGFYKLHDYAINSVLKALPTARVGGPDLAGGADDSYLGDFLEHCAHGTNYATGEEGTPLDFISFHSKGAPLFVNSAGDVVEDGASDGFVQMNVSTQLQEVDGAFSVVASFPQYKDTPIIMGEYDPDSCAACTSSAYGYRNGLLYGAYSAASFTRAMDLAANHGVNLQGALTWAFEYEQNAILPNETGYFDGYRVLSTQGIDKPVLNFHRMWGMLSGDRIKAESSGQVPLDVVLSDGVRGDQADVGALATFDNDAQALYVFVWHYHDNNLDFPDAKVSVEVEGLPATFSNKHGKVTATHYRVDDNHSNSYAKWLSMGSPQDPTPEQYHELVRAGKLATLGAPKSVHVSKKGTVSLDFPLPIRALSLLVLEKGDGSCSP
ncbi:glycoside hydrolase [Aspergillus lucknowensis]|uniref:Glycoside hydrolase n=1 Tax=Aspergillus lucknowensis TaxID=176173 RepID=A0ABR4LJ16_9EURO